MVFFFDSRETTRNGENISANRQTRKYCIMFNRTLYGLCPLTKAKHFCLTCSESLIFKVLSAHYSGLLGVRKFTVKCLNIKYQIHQNIVGGLPMLPWCSTKQFSASSHLHTVYSCKRTKFIMDYCYTDRASVGGNRGQIYTIFFISINYNPQH